MNIMDDFNQQNNRPSVSYVYDPIYPKITTDCAMPSTSNNIYHQSVFSLTTTTTTSPVNNFSTSSNNVSSTSYTNFQSIPANTYSFYPNFNNAPYLMTFPISTNSTDSSYVTSQISLRCKRKTDSPVPRNVKQHITEERMAEHLSKLHISSETPPSSHEGEILKERRLYMCEEMRKLQTTENIIPQSLLNKLEKPCTALVLWRPPPRILSPLRIPNENDNSNNNNNNEEDVQDNNTMDLDMR